MKRTFEKDLKQLKNKLTEMMTLCQEGVSLSINDFITGTQEHLDIIKDIELKINRLEQDIESDCIRFFIQQTPVAKDLRNVSSLLKMITDIERISDMACDISIITKTTNVRYAPNTENFIEMTKKVLEMLDLAIKSVSTRDLELANEVISLDSNVDELYYIIKNDIIKIIKSANGNESEVIDVLIVAKYLERIADHSTNIAEWIIYYLIGIHKGE